MTDDALIARLRNRHPRDATDELREEAAARIAALTQQVAVLEQDEADMNTIARGFHQRATKAEADGERYRFLLTRDPEEFISDATGENCWHMETKEEFDAAIDRARKREQP